jgi:RNase P/RNase MRP subunit p29
VSTETDNVACIVVNETDKAFRLRDKSEDREAWFPKSEIHFERRNVKTGDAVAVIPLWLLTSKGWNN